MSKIRCGVFGGRGDARGLAYQTQAYVKHLDVERTYCIDMTSDNLSPYENDFRPFTDHCDEVTINRYSQLDEREIRTWMRGLDVILGAETFYVEAIPNWAREEGVKTALVINPEFSSWHLPNNQVPRPDVFINPTTWRSDEYPDAFHVPMPVDREDFPFRLRTEAVRFVHVAGHAAAADRAGTRIVIGAIPRLTGTNIIIRSQSLLGRSSPIFSGKVQEGNLPSRNGLYDDADVVVIPRRYGGNHLTYNEAASSGCPIICLNRAPENSWGGSVTITSRARSKLRTKGGHIPVFDGANSHLVQAIQKLKSDPARVERLSLEADRYAESISWTRLRPLYEDFLKAVADGKDDYVLRGLIAAFHESPSSDIPSSS